MEARRVSNTVTGQVFKVYEKQFSGKPMTYSVKLEDNPIYYRLGTNRQAGVIEPGRIIQFSATPNADGKSATVQGAVTNAAAPPAAASGTPAFGGDRQNSIVYQSSLKSAIEFISTAVKAGAIKLPAKDADKLGVLEAALDRYTAQFFNDVNTLGAVTRELEGGFESPPGPASGGDEDE
jgi:hypothetical protein